MQNYNNEQTHTQFEGKFSISLAESKKNPVRLAPLGWRADLDPPLQKGEAVELPGLIEKLHKK